MMSQTTGRFYRYDASVDDTWILYLVWFFAIIPIAIVVYYVYEPSYLEELRVRIWYKMTQKIGMEYAEGRHARILQKQRADVHNRKQRIASIVQQNTVQSQPMSAGPRQSTGSGVGIRKQSPRVSLGSRGLRELSEGSRGLRLSTELLSDGDRGLRASTEIIDGVVDNTEVGAEMTPASAATDDVEEKIDKHNFNFPSKNYEMFTKKNYFHWNCVQNLHKISS